MKAKIKNSETFKPLTLELTFETQEELNAMYVLANCGIAYLQTAIEHCEAYKGTESLDYDILNDITSKIYDQLKDYKK